MAALRAWAEPGLRARLIRAAWDAGNQNINELAEAARVDRKTVYADLASMGIDPKTDRTQGEPVLTAPITVSGMYGDDRDTSSLDAYAVTALRDRTGLNREQATSVYRERWYAHEAAAWHNETIPAVQAHDEAVREAERAMRLWDAAYETLGQARTADWAAAHHRYQVAWAHLEPALQHLIDCRAKLRKLGSKLSTDGRKVYEEAVHKSKRHRIPADDNDAEQFEEARAEHNRRAEIAARTLRLLAGETPG